MDKHRGQHFTRSSASDSKKMSPRCWQLYRQFAEDDDDFANMRPAQSSQPSLACQSVSTTSQLRSSSLPTSNTGAKPVFPSQLNSRHQTSDIQKRDTVQQFERMAIDLPWNYMTRIAEEDDHNEETTQEFDSTEGSLIKEMRTQIEKTPSYLTRTNQSFQQMVHRSLQSIGTTIITNNQVEALRAVAVLIYKIMVIQTYQSLLTTHLKSGLGQLITLSQEQPSYSTTTSVWSKEIKKLLSLSPNDNAHDVYLNCVRLHLDELEHRLIQYKAQLNTQSSSVINYSFTVQQTITVYIEEYLQPFRSNIEHQVELIHHEYHIRALKLEYCRQNPTPNQMQLMKQICESKYEQETTEQEYHLLKRQIDYYTNSPDQSFERSSMALSPELKLIQNTDAGQQLFSRYKDTAVQSRASLFQLYLTTAEGEREQYKRKYEENIKRLQLNQQSTDQTQRIPSAMLQIIHRRCEKISERIKCSYNYKRHSTATQSSSFEI